MIKFSSGRMAAQQGSLSLFSDYADGGTMWTGQGPRESRHAVIFAEPFLGKPAVMVALSMWDIDHKHNARAEIAADKVSEAGFEVVFRTWGDTRVARVRADWTALGTVRDDEDWDVL
jgi:H-type lectin domain